MITVFPHIIAAATILFGTFKPWKFQIVSSLIFLLCNKNLNSFLTRWVQKRIVAAPTIWGNMYLTSTFDSQVLTLSIWNSNKVAEWAPPVPTMDVDVSMIDIWDGTTRAGGQKFFYTQRWNVVLLLFYIPGRQNFWDGTESTVYLQQL